MFDSCTFSLHRKPLLTKSNVFIIHYIGQQWVKFGFCKYNVRISLPLQNILS
jgi:hypothetical protein